MAEYSDTTEQVFRQAVENLGEAVPGTLHTRLRALLEEGSFHEPDAIESAIRDTVETSSTETE